MEILTALEIAIECGKYEEREMMINTLQHALDNHPDLPIDHLIPGLLEHLKAIPAPQTWIDMQRARMLFPTDEHFTEYMNRKDRRKKRR
jgi:hypothetical protein